MIKDNYTQYLNFLKLKFDLYCFRIQYKLSANISQ